MPLARNTVVSVEIDDLAYGGLGIGRVDGFVVFVEQALPGDRVRARIRKAAPNHAHAVIEAIERPAADRVERPPCPLFGTCGGCTWQNLPYESQLRWKAKQVADTLRHLGKVADVPIDPIIPSPRIWRYRNKMEHTFGRGDDGRILLGFHVPGRFDRTFEVPACLIQPESFDAMLDVLTQWARRTGPSVYHPRTHEGFLRHAVMRYSFTTGESLLALITQEGELPERDALWEALRARVPGLKGMVWGIHCGVADVARIGEERWRIGDPQLEEAVNGLTFAISPQSFFQTNTAAAALLYERVVELAQLEPDHRVLDAYCGTGAIGLHCARRAGRVVGVESVTAAVWDARANARRNGIEHATFLAAPLDQGLDLARRAAGGDFTHVILDPPRGGMDKRSLRGLIALGAPVMIYVSCNPATLARDLAVMTEAGYRVERVQPVDMFPHTYHIETLVRLTRRGG